MSKLIFFMNLFIIITILKIIQAKSVPGRRVCLTETCVIEASVLLNTIDKSVSPCDDFYQFSCGKWIQNKQLPEHKPLINQFSVLQDELNAKLKDLMNDIKPNSQEFIKNTKKYYDSCLNTTRIDELGDQPLHELLDQFGGWPQLSKRKKKQIDWADNYLKLRQLGHISTMFFTISVDPDMKDNTQRILSIDQPTFGLGSRESVLKGDGDPSIKAYKNLITKSALKLGAPANATDSIVSEIFNLEVVLANNSMPKELRRNMTEIYNKLTVRQLIKLAPNINWLKILKGYVSDDITDDEEIVLFDTQYIKAFNKLILTYSNRFLTNFMTWRVIKDKMSSLNEEWLQLLEQFDLVTKGMKSQPPRWQKCISNTMSTSFGMALSYIYVTNFFSDDDKDKASEMFTNVVKEFKRSLEANTWMGDKTRVEALKKLNNMKLLVGYPNELKDETKIERYYRGLQMDSGDFFGNSARLSKWYIDMQFSEMREPVDPYDWRDLSSVAEVNAYYYDNKNLIVMPAGILQSVFFNRERPSYLNYGSIAYIAGHEMIHGFDDGGRQLDSKGNLRNWWDNKTDQLYTQKSQCFINQYNNFKLKDINEYVNGFNTQGENIADNGGILQSYRAYLKYIQENGPEPQLPSIDYTPEQLFWISSAAHWCSKATDQYLKNQILTDPHSPSKARGNCVVSNSAEFAEAFNCPLNSPMNPANKCNIW